ncbi:MAG: thiol:disulfide interchange protein DsbC [Oleiphilaceae bacterium]|jgi:thiol:disulfide interchange protein DsbC
MKKVLALFVSSTLSLSVLAQDANTTLPEALNKALSESVLPDAETFREEVKINLEKKGDIIGIKELPMKKLFFVEAEKGSYVVSADGRFVFDGRLVDVWHRKTIKNLVDAQKIQRTPVSNIGFEPEEQLATFQFGNPDLPRSGVAFVDPTSEYTMKFLQYITDNQEKYNFTVILMPLVGGENAVNRSMKLWCSIDRKGAKEDFLKGNSSHLEEMRSDCKQEPIQMAKFMVNVFNITDLPHIIREDGLTSEGLPVNFDNWFTQP